MKDAFKHLFEKLACHGVVHRNEAKNYSPVLERLLRKGFLEKVFKNGKVFYEATQKALPLLDSQRVALFEMARLKSQLSPNSKFYKALLEDLRFLDKSRPEAEDYKFLGDWQLKRKAVPSQLELSKLRYYDEQVA